VVVVAHPALGTLNHTALTLEALAHRGLRLAGVVLGSWPDDPDLACRCNIRDLETLAARPLAGALRAGAGGLDPAEFLLAARAGLAPEFGGGFDAADFRTRWGR
jgi:dethiobiotin synthetase